ncbi:MULTISPECIES: amino acid permease [unclassified Sphingobium]|uniref:amino acid permease n=1 Tax=unclassified Sphingobium TaxID=2611147 RepID=UPI000D17B339|nr:MULTISPECIES: amino acid permease [unclassified Sphingobium]MBG6120450.1 ethanolamine permease [Sphingobium sp. JAI105]PSO10046.1 amino acid permease [Sphingobium sp. AEW4]TWC98941.1 ethanolamine:proton symporter (EAT family) [Sphingobium sp. AEW010]TWD18420.1 ethanolamine:proton symporter (EAT family) [Sphingobium sp. AEW013]TWD21048.1 ethanolamine:proton symporter (EAT family) [Sphingobium sp. AEW001]
MELQHGRLRWPLIAGLSVSTVVAGQFAGWNFGLANGWSNMFAATLLSAALYTGLALCVAELSAALPSAGGFSAYVREAFGRFPGFLTGFAVFVALAIGTGVAANFLGSYVSSLLGIEGWPIKLAMFVLVIAVHLCGVGEALGLVLAAGVVAVLSLLLFCISCLPHFHIENLTGAQSGASLSPRLIFRSIPFAIWLFLGLEQAAIASEEAHDPGRTMPRALIVAIAILVVTACGVMIFAPGVAGTAAVAQAGDPLYVALGFGSGGKPSGLMPAIIGLGAIFGLFATFFSLCYAASRQLFSLARDNGVPSIFGATNRRGAPAAALVTIGIIGMPISTLPADSILLGVVLLLATTYVAMLAAFLKLRMTRMDLHRPFKAPFGSALAAITLALAGVAVVACFQLSWPVLGGVCGAMIVGVCFYLLCRKDPKEQTHAAGSS